MATSKEMTEGRTLPQIFYFTLPLLLGNMLQQTYSLVDAAIVGKFVGSALPAKATGETTQDSLSMGILMNTRGLMELIVLNIGYEMGILPQAIYVMLVIMAVVTTFITTPALSLIEKIYERPKEVEEIQQTQAQVQTVRTNAYYSDSNGNVYKMPIKVEIRNQYNMVSIYVSEYYQNNGVQGYWYRLPSKPKAMQCMPQYAQNQLEQRFMYKVMINSRYYYFDI